ncbi:hypothetical protein BGX38DRAFT_1176470 [Terfezia claveryi]|nr:hypothetical protein BGX38DRAFT_1176470 [Terfezia claveryi]
MLPATPFRSLQCCERGYHWVCACGCSFKVTDGECSTSKPRPKNTRNVCKRAYTASHPMVYAPPLRSGGDSTSAGPSNDAPPIVPTILPGLSPRHDNAVPIVERSSDHNSGERQFGSVVMVGPGLGVTLNVDDQPPIVAGKLEGIELPTEAMASVQNAEDTTQEAGIEPDLEPQGQHQRDVVGITRNMTDTKRADEPDQETTPYTLFRPANLSGLSYTMEDEVNALEGSVGIDSQIINNHHESVHDTRGSSNTTTAVDGEPQFVPHAGLAATAVQTRTEDTLKHTQQPAILEAGVGQFQQLVRIEAIEDALQSFESRRLQLPVVVENTSSRALAEHHIVQHDARLPYGEQIKAGATFRPEEGANLELHVPLDFASVQTATGPGFTGARDFPGLPGFSGPIGPKLYQEDDNYRIEAGNIECQANRGTLSEHETVQELTVDTDTQLDQDPAFVHWRRTKLSQKVSVKFKVPVQPRKNLLRDALVSLWRRNRGDMNIINHFPNTEGNRNEKRASSSHRDTSVGPSHPRRRNPGIHFISPEKIIASPAVPQARISQGAYVEHPVMTESREHRGGEMPTVELQATVVRLLETNFAPPLSLVYYENWAWAWTRTPRVFTPVWQWFWFKWHFPGMTLRDAYPIGKWPRVCWFETILSTPAGRKGKTSRLLSMWINKYRLFPEIDTNPAPPDHSVEFLWYLHHVYVDVFDRRAPRIGHVELLLTAEEVGFYAHLGSFQMTRAQCLASSAP